MKGCISEARLDMPNKAQEGLESVGDLVFLVGLAHLELYWSENWLPQAPGCHTVRLICVSTEHPLQEGHDHADLLGRGAMVEVRDGMELVVQTERLGGVRTAPRSTWR